MMYGDPQSPTSTPGKFNAADRRRTDYNFDVAALVRYAPAATQVCEIGYARKTRSPNLYERYAWSTNTMAMEMINFAGDGNFYTGNLDLEPEVANTLSLTADLHDNARKQWGLQVTPFYTYVQDYIDVRRCPAGTVCSSTAAVTTSLTAKTGFVYLQFANQSARLYGVDISGYVPLSENGEYGSFRATGVVSYVDGKNQTTGDNLYNIMPLNAKLAVVQRVAGWTNSAEIHLVSAKTQVSQVRNELKTGGYGLLNLRSRYEWKRARVDISLENALNKFYASPLGGAYVGQGSTMSGSAIPWGIPIPGMGRSINTGLTVKF
jgi:iron complex outermembrane receptor protein